jgi:hypothetical protein
MCKQCATRAKNTLKQTTDGKIATPFKYQTKEIKRVSTHQQKLNLAYTAQRKIYLKRHPICEVRTEGCTGKATTVHHRKGRIGTLMLDEKYWLACCMECHNFIEIRPEWAKEKGFSLNRLTI